MEKCKSSLDKTFELNRNVEKIKWKATRYLHQMTINQKIFAFSSIAQFHYPLRDENWKSQELVLCPSQNIICLRSFSIWEKVKCRFEATLWDDKLLTTTKEKQKERLHVLPKPLKENLAELPTKRRRLLHRKSQTKSHHLKASTKRQIILINYSIVLLVHKEVNRGASVYRSDRIRDDYSVKFHQIILDQEEISTFSGLIKCRNADDERIPWCQNEYW